MQILKNIRIFILIAVLLAILAYCDQKSPPDIARENFRKELETAIPVQEQTFAKIKRFMNDKDADESFYASLWYHATFFSPNYDKAKLILLDTELKKNGWKEPSVDKIMATQTEYAYSTYSAHDDPFTPGRVILCKNNATIVLNTQDLKNTFPDALYIRTYIELFYVPDSPCNQTYKQGEFYSLNTP